MADSSWPIVYRNSYIVYRNVKRNPKHEYRNPKQIQIFNVQNSKRFEEGLLF